MTGPATPHPNPVYEVDEFRQTFYSPDDPDGPEGWQDPRPVLTTSTAPMGGAPYPTLRDAYAADLRERFAWVAGLTREQFDYFAHYTLFTTEWPPIEREVSA